MDENLHPPFPKKVTQELQRTTLTAIAAQVYMALLLTCIKFEIKKIPRKNHNHFWRNRSLTSLMLTVRRILEWVLVKNTEETLRQSIWLHTPKKDGSNFTSVISPPKKLLQLKWGFIKTRKQWLTHLMTKLLFWHCWWSLVWRYINTICDYYLPILWKI